MRKEPVDTKNRYDTKYELSPEFGVEPVNDPGFEDRVGEERAEYECTCGKAIEGYGAVVDHLERADGA